MDIVYNTMEEAIGKAKPVAVFAFNNIYEHLKVVEFCAPRGIHVMVEKPLAVSNDHVTKMMALAKKHTIFLLTNYETTWYGSNAKAYQVIKEEKRIGDIRKIVFHTGHRGPVEIGCSAEFLHWLTDPVLNGGGALIDFGCYGADLATWLMNGETNEQISQILGSGAGIGAAAAIWGCGPGWYGQWSGDRWDESAADQRRASRCRRNAAWRRHGPKWSLLDQRCARRHLSGQGAAHRLYGVDADGHRWSRSDRDCELHARNIGNAARRSRRQRGDRSS